MLLRDDLRTELDIVSSPFAFHSFPLAMLDLSYNSLWFCLFKKVVCVYCCTDTLRMLHPPILDTLSVLLPFDDDQSSL